MGVLIPTLLLGLSIYSVQGIWPNPSDTVVQTSKNIKISLCNIKLVKNSPEKFNSTANCMIDGAFNRALALYKKVSSCTPLKNPTIVTLSVTNPDKMSSNPAQDDLAVESYQIQISSGGIVSINAETTIGALRSAWTLFQIPEGKFVLHPVTVTDAPLMPYRSILVDTTRSISETLTQRHSIQRLYEIVDKMEIVKLNVLHWHLTDTDGISFPFSNMNVFDPYSIASLKQLVNYAMLRGITVIPEVDMVGHSGQIWANQANMPSFVAPDCPKQLNLDSTQATNFVLDLFKALYSDIFQQSPILGFGNDEVAPCGNNYRSTFTSLNNGINQLATTYGKNVMIWADTILDQNMSFNKQNTIVAVWKISETRRWKTFPEQLNYLASLGYKVVNVNQDPWYIGWTTDARSLYNYNPLGGVSSNFHRNIIGGSVALWEPSIDDLEEQYVLWPKSASVAEILWSSTNYTGNGFNESRYNDISEWIDAIVTNYNNPLCT